MTTQVADKKEAGVRKGATVSEVEREFVSLGGAVERDRPDHVTFKYPGLPTVGVHSSRVRAPRRLVSLLRRVQEGRVVSPARQGAPARPEEHVVVEARHRFVQRPNPTRAASVAAPAHAESTLEMIERLARQRALDRDGAIARQSQRTAEPPRPYAPTEAPVTWTERGRALRSLPNPHAADGPAVVYAYEDAARDGMARTYADPAEYFDDLAMFLTDEVLARIRQRGPYAKHALAVIRPVRGIIPSGRTATLSTTEVGTDQPVIIAVAALPPAPYAHFRAGWQRGIDRERRCIRDAGLAV